MTGRRHLVVNYAAAVDGAEAASRLLDYLNQRRLTARVNERGEVAIVWEIAELDQLAAFLRELSSSLPPWEEPEKSPHRP